MKRRSISRSSFQVLLIVETSRAYGRGIVEGVSKYAFEQGNWFIHFQDRGLVEMLPEPLSRWRGDGIITRTATEKLHRLILAKNLPYVELFGSGMPEILCDEKMVGRMAAEHFIERGLKNFAYFAIGCPWWSKWRGECFERGLHCFGFSPIHFRQKHPKRSPLPIWDTAHDEELLDWLKNLPKPIGIFCAADIHAITILEYCRRLNIAVPEEVAVLGTDNDEMLCNVANPKISSIELDSSRIGYLAADLLHRRILGTAKKIATPILVPPLFVETRQSTDMIAIEDQDVAQAIRFIREKACSSITVADVARHVELSQATLFRRFRHHLGHSPEREIIRVRIDRAKKLLLETGFPLSVIASKTGFLPTEYFIRVFKRECGVTPNRFRTISGIDGEGR